MQLKRISTQIRQKRSEYLGVYCTTAETVTSTAGELSPAVHRAAPPGDAPRNEAKSEFATRQSPLAVYTPGGDDVASSLAAITSARLAQRRIRHAAGHPCAIDGP